MTYRFVPNIWLSESDNTDCPVCKKRYFVQCDACKKLYCAWCTWDEDVLKDNCADCRKVKAVPTESTK